jgi:hypothetical protein
MPGTARVALIAGITLCVHFIRRDGHSPAFALGRPHLSRVQDPRCCLTGEATGEAWSRVRVSAAGQVDDDLDLLTLPDRPGMAKDDLISDTAFRR